MRWYEVSVCFHVRMCVGRGCVGPNRTNEEAAEARAPPPPPAPHCCVREPSNTCTNTKRYGKIINYLTSFSQQAFSMVAWNIVAGSELLSSTSASRMKQKKTLVLWLCAGGGGFG